MSQIHLELGSYSKCNDICHVGGSEIVFAVSVGISAQEIAVAILGETNVYIFCKFTMFLKCMIKESCDIYTKEVET